MGPYLRLAAATLLGAALVFVLGGLLYLTTGLVIVAAVVGWGTAVAVRGPGASQGRRLGAVGAASLALTIGLLGAWGVGIGSGGTLGPVDFAINVFGPLLPLLYLIAGGVAWWGSGREPVPAP